MFGLCRQGNADCRANDATMGHHNAWCRGKAGGKIIHPPTHLGHQIDEASTVWRRCVGGDKGPVVKRSVLDLVPDIAHWPVCPCPEFHLGKAAVLMYRGRIEMWHQKRRCLARPVKRRDMPLGVTWQHAGNRLQRVGLVDDWRV